MAKSFSIKIGADTKEFNKSLRAADNQIRTTTRLGDALTKTLEHKYDAKTAEQAQKQFQKALSDTQDKAEALRKQLIHMEKAGEIDSNQYRKLETDLAKATIEASNLEKKIESLSKMKVDQLSKGFTDLGGKIEGAGKKIAPFSAAAAGAIAGAVKLSKDAVAVGDDIMTMSDQFDMSIKSIQRWQYVAMQTDVESATLLKAIQKTQAAFGEQATGGTTAAVKALETLGLSYKNFDSNEEMFQAVIDSLSGIDDKTIQVAYATDILGERFASALVPMLQSKDAIAGYIDEFEQVGYLSDEVVQQLAELDNEVNKVTAQFEMAKTQLGVAMIPIYERLIVILENYVIPAIEKLADWFDSLSPSMQNTILGVLALIAAAAPLLILVGKMSTGIGGLIKLFGKMKAASLSTAAGVAALVGALALGINLIADWKNMSTVEKILKSLAVAALVAAAAMTVFHASWSVGIAVGAIAAGVVAGIAAIKAASKEIGLEEEFSNDYERTSKGYSQQELDEVYNDIGYQQPTASQNSVSNSVVNNNSNDVFNIYIEANEYVSAEEVADIVSKKIATLSQSRG